MRKHNFYCLKDTFDETGIFLVTFFLVQLIESASFWCSGQQPVFSLLCVALSRHESSDSLMFPIKTLNVSFSVFPDWFSLDV